MKSVTVKVDSEIENYTREEQRRAYAYFADFSVRSIAKPQIRRIDRTERLRKSTFTCFITMQPWGDPRDDTRASRYTRDYPRDVRQKRRATLSRCQDVYCYLWPRDARAMASFLGKAVFRNARNSSRRNLGPASHRRRCA